MNYCIKKNNVHDGLICAIDAYFCSMTTTTCARCKLEMACMPENIAACPCSKLIFSDRLKAFLSKTTYACLCSACINRLESMLLDIEQKSQSVAVADLIQDKHYYVDKGLFVFTEYYHILKGSCCGNHCRHCAYGLSST